MSGDAWRSESAALIGKAIDAVGRNEPGNCNFFADKFEERHIDPLVCMPDTGRLVGILKKASVKTAVAAYDEADKSAIREQRRYNWATGVAVTPILLSVLAGLAVVVVPAKVVASAIGPLAGLEGVSRENVILLWQTYAPGLVYLGLIAAAILGALLRPARSYLSWQQQRAKAEALRREIFRRVLEHPPASGDREGCWVLLLKLEYFRRWQVELQHEYFLKRGAEHARAVRRASLARAGTLAIFVLLAPVLLASAAGGYDEQGMPSAPVRGLLLDGLSLLRFVETWNWDYWLLLSGTLTAAAMVYYFVLGAQNRCKRNVPRYAIMGENFKDLLGERLDLAREGAACGEPGAVRKYADRVHSVMALELNDWVRLADLDLGLGGGYLSSDGPVATATAAAGPAGSV